jgi:hypothetical protein
MLNGITWGQFTIFILVLTGIYYLYVFGRYYASEVLSRMKYRAFKASETTATGNAESSQKKAEQPAPKSNTPMTQAELFGKEGPGGADDEQ